MKRRARRGFTLLEVMVSMAILGVCLTAVFSTEAGTVRMAARARKMGFATLLARCKMGEIEEELALKGLPPALTTGSDECCEDAEIDGFKCDWEIEPVIMPETMFGGGTDAEATALLGAAAPGAAPPAEGSMPTSPSDLMAGGAEVDAMASLAMSYVYPVLKPSFEAQIRRTTVTVHWREGSSEQSFDVTQYLVADPNAISAAAEVQAAQAEQPPASQGAPE